MNVLRLLPRFREAYRELPKLEARERWSREEIESFQLERLNAVWAHAIAHVPHYRRLRRERSGDPGLPDRFESLDEFRKRVPILVKPQVRSATRAFLSEQAEPGRWHRTGGSTGSPMRIYWSMKAHRESLRAQYRFHDAWGLDILEREAYLWGHSAQFAPGWEGRLVRFRRPLEDRLRGRLRLSAYRLGRDDLRRYLRRIAAFRPASIYGYSSALDLLAREAEIEGYQCDSLRLFRLTGEPAFPHMVRRIEDQFGVPAVVEYGSHECGITACEMPDRTLRLRDDRVLAETVRRDDGRYDIVLTVLDNPSFPLLRYAIEDTTDAPIEPPERGFATLSNVSGRNNDLVISRSGRHLHSSTFDGLFKYGTTAVRRFRVRQRSDGTLAVALELDDPFAAIDFRGLERDLVEVVEGYPVTIETVESLPLTSAGKHRMVVSDLVDAAGNGREPVAGRAVREGEEAGGSSTPGTTAARAAVHSTPRSSPPENELSARAKRLRTLLDSPELSFIMEAHDGLSAKIVEEAGFEAIWASGLAISAALGVRDSNEASWTQVLEVLEFMSDATRLPILVDGDTGYGNFNNMRRLVRKLEQRGIAGVCIEDKTFPKTNSFIRGTSQPLAAIEEFSGRIRAGKEAQSSSDFVIVARVEAFIAGWGLAEALKRAEAYRQAGADAILIHSAKAHPGEVLAFKREWGSRLPVVIVPTKYYSTPTEMFREVGFSAVIWANHMIRSCITAMQRSAQQIFEDQSLINTEDRISSVAEIFRLQGAQELTEAEKRYLPRNADVTRAIILATEQGPELGALTEDRPKAMVEISGASILSHAVETYRATSIRDIAIVRGYRKEAVNLDGVKYFDNDDVENTGEAFSLSRAAPALQGRCIISPGDVLFKKVLLQELMETEDDFAVLVDADWKEGQNRKRAGGAQYVSCSEPCCRSSAFREITLTDIGSSLDPDRIHGEWTGFLAVSDNGAHHLRALLSEVASTSEARSSMDLAGLVRRISESGKAVRVIYTTGNWLGIESVDDVLQGSSFR
jgi:phosphoenolpyruvate phosphomutase